MNRIIRITAVCTGRESRAPFPVRKIAGVPVAIVKDSNYSGDLALGRLRVDFGQIFPNAIQFTQSLPMSEWESKSSGVLMDDVL